MTETPPDFAFAPGEKVADAVRRIAKLQLESAISAIDAADPADPVTVHKFRRTCKRLRSLLRLVRGELEPSGVFHRENGILRDAARQFSVLRDADVTLGTFDGLMAAAHRPDRRAFAPIRAALTRKRRLIDGQGDIAAAFRRARHDLVQMLDRVDRWPLDRAGFDAVRFGLHKTYRRSYRRRLEAMDAPDLDVLHEWRKRTKYHRQQIRLIGFVWPPMVDVRQAEADRLADLLGDERDLTMLGEMVATDDAFVRIAARNKFVGLARSHADSLRQTAFALGTRLFAQAPEDFVHGVETWWQGFQGDSDEASEPLDKPKPRRRAKDAARRNGAPDSPAAFPEATIGNGNTIALSDVLGGDMDLVQRTIATTPANRTRPN